LVRLRLSAGRIDGHGRRKGDRRHEHRSNEDLHDAPPYHNDEADAPERIVVSAQFGAARNGGTYTAAIITATISRY
jgi:hypothetical protein